MEQVGTTYLFDCGEVVLKVKYLSDRRLAWEYVKGPEAGLNAEEDHAFAVIRPAVYFMWWQEEDTGGGSAGCGLREQTRAHDIRIAREEGRGVPGDRPIQ